MSIKKEMDFRFDVGSATADGLRGLETIAPESRSLIDEVFEIVSEIDISDLIAQLGEPFDPDKYHEELEEFLYDLGNFERAGIDPYSDPDPDWVRRSERVSLMMDIETVIGFREAQKALMASNN